MASFIPASQLMRKNASTSASPKVFLQGDSDDDGGEALVNNIGNTPGATPLSEEKAREFDQYFGEFDEMNAEDGEALTATAQVSHMRATPDRRRWAVIGSNPVDGSTMLLETPNFLPYEKEWTVQDWIARLTPSWQFVLWVVLLLGVLVIFSDELIPEEAFEFWQALKEKQRERW